jgi:hypothetical protein
MSNDFLLKFNALLTETRSDACPICKKEGCLNKTHNMNEDYIGFTELPINFSSIIKLDEYKNYNDYENSILNIKKNKKSIKYPFNLSKRNGYYCKQLERKNHLQDIYEINNSKEFRSGGKMKESYLNEENFKNPNLKELQKIKKIENYKEYYKIHYGIFKEEKGYKQFDLITNEKLIGLIVIDRVYDMIKIDYILGHNDYLSHGIMYHLFFDMMENWVFKKHEASEGVDYIFYAGHFQGNSNQAAGLMKWKEKFNFKPYLLIANEVNNIKPYSKVTKNINIEYYGNIIKIISTNDNNNSGIYAYSNDKNDNTEYVFSCDVLSSYTGKILIYICHLNNVKIIGFTHKIKNNIKENINYKFNISDVLYNTFKYGISFIDASTDFSLEIENMKIE